MKNYSTNQIRNIALLGHTGSGKTSLAEALLYHSGTRTTLGSTEQGSTCSDFTDLEKEYEHSLETSVLQLGHGDAHINLLDTPGLPDCFGRALGALPAVETVALVINAQRGIETIAQRAYQQLIAQHKCGLIIINHIDGHGVEPAALIADIQARFGKHCLPINLPDKQGNIVDCYFKPSLNADVQYSSVAEVHDALIDQVVEVDEALLELYLEQGESLQPEQLHDPFEQALREGHLIPVCFTSAINGAGIKELLDIIANLMPTPLEGNEPGFVRKKGDTIEPVKVKADPIGHAIAHVFRMSVDPFVGRMGVFRVHQGTIKVGEQLFIGDNRKSYRVNHLLKLQGAKHTEVSQAIAGDICAIAKVEALHVGAVLHDSHDEDHFSLPGVELPVPLFGLAVRPKKRGDEQKMADVLHRLVAEDPSLQIEYHERENETLLMGLGDFHVQIALEKARRVYGLDLDTSNPSIAYRETISREADGHHRHKKQTGGAGQFGEVFLHVEPLERGAGFEFQSKVVGGAIPSQFISAVEKGVREVMDAGAIAGYPLQDIRVVVCDGKTHPVDSKEIAFVTAGKKAFLDAIEHASPVILEPFVNMHIIAPEEKMGDITGDMASQRGIVNGTEALPDHLIDISVLAPLANLSDYGSKLKSITGGEGDFSMNFSHYAEAPGHVQQGLCDTHHKQGSGQ